MLTNKQKRKFKIVIGIIMLIAVGIVAEYLFEYFTKETSNQMSFFANHLSLGIVLILVGIIAFLLPFTTRTRFGEGKGDNMILVVGILLILCGIITIPLTFLFS